MEDYNGTRALLIKADELYRPTDTDELRMEKVYFDVAHDAWLHSDRKLPEPRPHWKGVGAEAVIDYDARNSWIENGLIPFPPGKETGGWPAGLSEIHFSLGELVEVPGPGREGREKYALFGEYEDSPEELKGK